MPPTKEIDKYIVSWILELLLRQRQVPDALINKMLASSHAPWDNDNECLKKTVLLRSIDSEIRNGSISETILQSLEIIEELDRNKKVKILDSMKHAYCAVALDCTVKYMWGNLHAHCQAKYVAAVNRIWRGRIHKLEMLKMSELVTDELKRCQGEIEAALSDSNVVERLQERNTQKDALILTGIYINEATAIMGPSFLESVARIEKENIREKKGKEVGSEKAAKDKAGEKSIAEKEDLRYDCSIKGANHHSNPDSGDVDGQRISELDKSMVVMLKPVFVSPLSYYILRRSKVPARISNSNELDVDIGSISDIILPTPELNQTKANSVIVELSRKDMNQETLIEKQNEDADVANPSTLGPEKDITEHSLTERNGSAPACEKDSVDSVEVRTNHPICLDSPKGKNVSALGKSEAQKFAIRRKMRRWAVEEEDALREGVEKFGIGKWKEILHFKHDIFVKRTEVDLKDKWRNMTKWS
ncbi:uncharacterized protein LOC105643614 isoform X2 [Jatropha curcas]|uniref:uncharacterized protein LOC105643614 isoform X2 n=1 Tax=Jatropha curcas TaxID=180498 RepID=UPI0005FAE82F|nr:uncharacterized protein LOC105643614 isoform X2 [Jatropha curcas]